MALTATMSLESPLLHDAGSGEDNAARRRVQQAQRSLQHPDGEPLTVVAALAGYEAAASRQQYCRLFGGVLCTGKICVVCCSCAGNVPACFEHDVPTVVSTPYTDMHSYTVYQPTHPGLPLPTIIQGPWLASPPDVRHGSAAPPAAWAGA